MEIPKEASTSSSSVVLSAQQPLPPPLLSSSAQSQPQQQQARTGDSQIYKATYSGVPVWEMRCKSVAVMRRKSDGWLNATQILKVAEFDKPHRTRILEREVQKGEHEKVQGGYGKYQGTWVPHKTGVSLAEKYNVKELLAPIFDYDPSALASPPLAPKHITAASSKPRKPRENLSIDTDIETNTNEGEAISRRQSEHNGRPQKLIKTVSATARQYGEQMLKFFTARSSIPIPDFLLHPPADFDPNVKIDQQEHTALHWSAATGKNQIARILIQSGADIAPGNVRGETPLMRSVVFPYCYDSQGFNELLNLLRDSLCHHDYSNQTVLHHVVTYAGTKGRDRPAKYYMENLLNQLATQQPEEYRSYFVNLQNNKGDTALNIAARNANKKLVKLLLDAGGDPQIRNRENKNAEDYILEHEAEAARLREIELQKQKSTHTVNLETSTSTVRPNARNRLIPSANAILQDFQECYEARLLGKKKELIAVQSDLQAVKWNIEVANNSLEETKTNTDKLPELKEREAELERLVREKLDSRYAERIQASYESELKNIKNVNTNVDSTNLAELREKVDAAEKNYQMSIGTVLNTMMASETKLAKYKKLIENCSGIESQKFLDKIGTPISPYPIKLKSEVVKGFGRGSKELGIPTANLSEDTIGAVCNGVSTGIYYGWAQVVGKGGKNDFPTTPVYPMVMSLGWNPYYKNEKQSAEVHIIHVFPTDFYGEELRVIVLGYIRPERDYSSLEELIQDINTDIQVAHNSLKRDGYSRFQRDEFFVSGDA
ncbi:3908_t:CDS:10 [Ambispora leptoticha]|uniref:riboflavin kinase n=1 Tax=Ambispora leptoticha TaxID=144679 RepID=A0A9N9FPX2_9GLOM|nr:3908_t:CDS:10 [Ambispora leptoticha]